MYTRIYSTSDSEWVMRISYYSLSYLCLRYSLTSHTMRFIASQILERCTSYEIPISQRVIEVLWTLCDWCGSRSVYLCHRDRGIRELWLLYVSDKVVCTQWYMDKDQCYKISIIHHVLSVTHDLCNRDRMYESSTYHRVTEVPQIQGEWYGYRSIGTYLYDTKHIVYFYVSVTETSLLCT